VYLKAISALEPKCVYQVCTKLLAVYNNLGFISPWNLDGHGFLELGRHSTPEEEPRG
jgi:hypothetical protein